jgi:hypothetical protein
MLERARLNARTVQLPRGMVGEKLTNRYKHPETGMIIYAEPGHLSIKDTKLVPIISATDQEKK